MKNAVKSKGFFSLSFRLSVFCLLLLANPKRVSAPSGVSEFYYYYYAQKIYLKVSTEMISACFTDTTSREAKEALIRSDPALTEASIEVRRSRLVLATVKERLSREEVAQAVERLNKLPEVQYSTPVFEFDHLKLILTDEFVVRFKANMTEQDIAVVNNENGVTGVRRSPYRHNCYVLRVMNPKRRNALEMAKRESSAELSRIA